ncbi:hypothetical protein [Streptomyces sp. MST-110588]|uniref:hypothetical protein n=1 Tax=Streptomyces sp. MST-110588 TaxID=2833628 RepID=UPI001F5D4411|nr:hypothetical protein [Streptomyces sp. MST-110588]UNO43550.1 hypothetical protein KGS77_33835 [Streptomyces sp. MST-110588]
MKNSPAPDTTQYQGGVKKMTASGIPLLVARLRDALGEHREEHQLWAPDIPSGAGPWQMANGIPAGVAEILAIADGMHLDYSTQLFGSDVLPDRRMSELLAHAEPLDGCRLPDTSHFFCFGQAASNPLWVNEQDGSVWRVPDDGVLWYTGCRLERIADTMSDFFTGWVVTDRFRDLAGLPPEDVADNDWCRLLKLTGMAF